MNDHWLPNPTQAASLILEPEMLVLAPPLGNFLVFSGLEEPLPEQAHALSPAGGLGWRVINWTHEGSHLALAQITGPVRALGFALSAPGGGLLEIAIARQISGDIRDLAAFLQERGGPFHDVLRLGLAALEPSDSVPPALLAMLQDGTEAAGFVELAAAPECGGLFLQGWAQAPVSGPCRVISEKGIFRAEAAPFDRPDILAPASGLCLFAQSGAPALGHGPVFVQTGNRLLRLDQINAMASTLPASETETHLRAMLPQVSGSSAELGWFRRLCRPRFDGRNTLSSYSGPVAAACDCFLRGVDGGMFIAAWLLDPMHQVEAVLIKSTGNLYSRMDSRWHRMHRPDLNDGFAEDPRFSGLLTAEETLHGFLCYIPAAQAQIDGQDCYLELVIADGDCLFLPITPALCRDLDAGKAALACVPQHDPAHLEVVKDHVVPFLAGLPPRRQQRLAPLRCLGTSSLAKPVAALMAVRDISELSAIFAQLSDTEDAASLDLVIALDDTTAPDTLAKLDSQFRFYNLTGAVALMRPQMTRARRLDTLSRGVDADLLLLWDPAALPKQAGWLGGLRAAHRELGRPALLSPLLCYEDGSVHFAGARLAAPAREAICAVAGIGSGQISELAAEPVSAGAAELALVDRHLLEEAGGVAGRLLGSAHCHYDLGLRLREVGSSAWFTPAAEFWVLTAPTSETPDETALLTEFDAALIDYLQSQIAGATSERTL